VIIYPARCQWADYFDQQGVKYAFYSAADAAALQQARRDAMEAPNRTEAGQLSDESEFDDADDDGNANMDSEGNCSEDDTDGDDMYFSAEEEEEDVQDARARILSVQELEEMFIAMAPDLYGRLIPLRTYQLLIAFQNFLIQMGRRLQSSLLV